jgi:hypothetical protein
MQLHLSKYTPKKSYLRNGKKAILCKVRNKLIVKNPEELVRQAFVEYLIKEKNVPFEKIGIEYPLARKKKGERKRADIVVFGNETTENVVLVVECKKDDQFLTEKTLEQVKYYSSILKSNCTVITDGKFFTTFKKVQSSQKQINTIPKYHDLLSNDALKKYVVEKKPYARHSLKDLKSDRVHTFMKNWGHIGEDTHSSLYPFLTNIIDLLFDQNSTFEKVSFNGITIVKDLGTTINSYGNAGGGRWLGEFKKFLVKHKAGNHITVGIGVMASAKQANHPRFGNTRGFTTLVVAVDDFEKSHNSLQLNLDDYTEKNGKEYRIFHSGKLTNGNKGSIKYDIVKKYIKKHAPHLISEDNMIELGAFPDGVLYKHTDKFSIKFIKNLIEYALLRDEIRRLM